MDGYKTLKAGQVVSFEITQGPKGLHAVKIEGITASSPAAENVAAPGQKSRQEKQKA